MYSKKVKNWVVNTIDETALKIIRGDLIPEKEREQHENLMEIYNKINEEKIIFQRINSILEDFKEYNKCGFISNLLLESHIREIKKILEKC